MDGSDGMTLNPDGTVTLLGVKLRRPMIGELRKLREQQYDRAAHAGDMRDEVLALLAGEDKTDDQKVADRKAAEALSRKMTIDIEDANIAWLRDAIRLLGDGAELPSEDELPVWMLESRSGEILEHWKKIPVSPGER